MPQPARKPATVRRKRSARTADEPAVKLARPSQRERIVEAMIELAARSGYQRVSIAQVSSRAGVSSATFYEQFADKEECVLAAYQAAAERLLAEPMPVASNGNWPAAATETLRRLAYALQRDPNAGHLLFVETLHGGPRMRETRRLVLGGFERRVQEFLDSTPSGGETIDIPAVALAGAMRSIVARSLRMHAEDDLPSLAEDGVEWVRSYSLPPGTKHWSTGPGALLTATPADEQSPRSTRQPKRLPRGRHGLPSSVIARSQRTRIIHATAEVMMEKGYANATVADIVATAGVSRDVFYEHFSDKENAFLEAQQYPSQHILDSVAAAHFSAPTWPERLWNGLATLLGLIAENPALSHLRLVECYAAGPDAIRRAEDITRSFTIFFEEGYSYRPQARQLPRLCSQAIAGGIFEIIQRHIVRGDSAGLMRTLPQLTYIGIAPFTGAAEAIRLVSQISSSHARGELVKSSGA